LRKTARYGFNFLLGAALGGFTSQWLPAENDVLPPPMETARSTPQEEAVQGTFETSLSLSNCLQQLREEESARET
jgi:hypothetical protein